MLHRQMLLSRQARYYGTLHTDCTPCGAPRRIDCVEGVDGVDGEQLEPVDQSGACVIGETRTREVEP